MDFVLRAGFFCVQFSASNRIVWNKLFFKSLGKKDSFENWILHYRRCTDYLARKTSIDDNHSDCFKVLYIASRQHIRQNSKFAKKKDKKSYITQTIDSFFS